MSRHRALDRASTSGMASTRCHSRCTDRRSRALSSCRRKSGVRRTRSVRHASRGPTPHRSQCASTACAGCCGPSRRRARTMSPYSFPRSAFVSGTKSGLPHQVLGQEPHDARPLVIYPRGTGLRLHAWQRRQSRLAVHVERSRRVQALGHNEVGREPRLENTPSNGSASSASSVSSVGGAASAS